MIKLVGGDLWQWDSGRKVEIKPKAGSTVDAVHFFNGTTENAKVGILKDDGSAEIPNVFLQSSNNVVVYSVMVNESGEQTTESVVFSVNRREKPDDYVYTETEVLKWESLDERLKKVEEGGEADGSHYPIKRIESLDTEHIENLVNLRDLESGIYILYGYFKPFPGSDSTLIIDDGFYMVTRVDEGSHLLSISPLNFRMTCHEILVDDTNEKGFTYTNTRINLLDVHKAVSGTTN